MCYVCFQVKVKQHLTVYICVLDVLSGQGKTTLTVYICVLGVHSGQGKTTLTVHLYIRSGIRSRENNINIVLYIIQRLLCKNKLQQF